MPVNLNKSSAKKKARRPSIIPQRWIEALGGARNFYAMLTLPVALLGVLVEMLLPGFGLLLVIAVGGLGLYFFARKG